MFKKAVQSLIFLLGIVICVVPSNSWAGRGDPNFIDFDTFSMEGYSNADIIPSFFGIDLSVTKVETETGLPYLPIMDGNRGCFIDSTQDIEAAPVKNAVGISASVREFLKQVNNIRGGRVMVYWNTDEAVLPWLISARVIREMVYRNTYDKAVPLAEKAYTLAEELNKKVDSGNKEFLEGKKQLGRILESFGDNRKYINSDFSKAIEWYEKASSLASSGYERGKIDIEIMRCYQALAKEAEEKGRFEQAKYFHKRVVTEYEVSVKGSLIILDMNRDREIGLLSKSKSDIPEAYSDKSMYDAYYELKGDANFALGQSMYYLGAYNYYAPALTAFTEVEKILTDSDTYYIPWAYDEYEINLFKCLCYDKLGRDDEAFAELKKISSSIGLYKDAWKKRIEDRFYRETDIAAIGKYVGRYRLERELPDEYLMRLMSESKGY